MTEDSQLQSNSNQNGSRPSEEIAAIGSNSGPISEISVSDSRQRHPSVAIINSNLIADNSFAIGHHCHQTTSPLNVVPIAEDSHHSSNSLSPMLEYSGSPASVPVSASNNGRTTIAFGGGQQPQQQHISSIGPNVRIASGDIFGPIPNLFKWLHFQISHIELQLNSQEVSQSNQLHPTVSQVNLALNKEEQNLEIIFHDGQYYFEAIRTFKVADIKNSTNTNDNENVTNFRQEVAEKSEVEEIARAWLCKEIENKLVLKPGKSWINGTRTYQCLMCNQFSPYSNLLLLHMILTCPKIGDKQLQSKQTGAACCYSNNNTTTIANNNNNNKVKLAQYSNCNKDGEDLNYRINCQNHKPQHIDNGNKKRSFDIMSLLQNDKNCGQVDNQKEGEQEEEDVNDDEDDEKIDVETLEDTDIIVDDSAAALIRQYPNQFAKQSKPGNINGRQFQRQSSSNGNNGNVGGSQPQPQIRKYVRQNKTKFGPEFNGPRTPSNTRAPPRKSAFKKLKENQQQQKQQQPEQQFIESIDQHMIAAKKHQLNLNNNNRSDQNMSPNFPASLATLYSAHFGSVNNLSPGLASQIFANTFANFFQDSSSQLGPGPQPDPMAPGPTVPIQQLNNPGLTQDRNNNPMQFAGYSQPTVSAAFQNPNFIKPEYSDLVKDSRASSNNRFLKTPANFNPNSSQNPFEATFPVSSQPNQFSESPCRSDSSSLSSSSSPTPSSLLSNSPKSSLEVDEPHQSKPPKVSNRNNKSKQQPGGNNGVNSTTSQNLTPPYLMSPGGSSGNPAASSNNPLIASMYLMSPSLTALSYQASNVCAYCNTAFRMTSDLVYHMRSHHKKTMRDESMNKKRRDEPLRCNICNETFRERHHLTRHMTSHQ